MSRIDPQTGEQLDRALASWNRYVIKSFFALYQISNFTISKDQKDGPHDIKIVLYAGDEEVFESEGALQNYSGLAAEANNIRGQYQLVFGQAALSTKTDDELQDIIIAKYHKLLNSIINEINEVNHDNTRLSCSLV